MKKIWFLALAALLAACGQKKESCEPKQHPCYSYNATIYELNTRQFTPEGTFKAAEAELPRLKELGVDIIWVMPIQPIGVLERKGTLGSYYAIKDYCAFNPEFGTRADFASFLNKAHELGMKVILDWVANHTAPDHPWVNNEGWHMRDSLGNLVVNYDWYDIAELNYDNVDMRAAMTDAMAWWVDSIGIDGFRCDVAGEVPTDFWNNAMKVMRGKRANLFTLAEAEKAELNIEAFDMYYGWELHHIMNKVAQGEKTVEDMWSYFAKADTVFPSYAIRMNFTSNHDENSWNGTEFERMGKGAEAMAAFTYVVPGMPLIYNGQEYGMDKRLEFFEKDTVTVNPSAPQIKFYQQMNAFRKANKALRSNELGAEMVRLETAAPSVFACVREQEGNVVVGVFNFSAEPLTIDDLQLAAGTYTTFDGKQVEVAEDYSLDLAPWGYCVMAK